MRKRSSGHRHQQQPHVVHPVVSSISSSAETEQPAAEAASNHLQDHNGVSDSDVMQPGSSSGRLGATAAAPIVLIAKPLPRVLLLHCGGTLGMDPGESYTEDLEGHVVLREGTGGRYHEPTAPALKPPVMLSNLLTVVPELRTFAQLEVKVVMNKVGCRPAQQADRGGSAWPSAWPTGGRALSCPSAAPCATLTLHLPGLVQHGAPRLGGAGQDIARQP